MGQGRQQRSRVLAVPAVHLGRAGSGGWGQRAGRLLAHTAVAAAGPAERRAGRLPAHAVAAAACLAELRAGWLPACTPANAAGPAQRRAGHSRVPLRLLSRAGPSSNSKGWRLGARGAALTLRFSGLLPGRLLCVLLLLPPLLQTGGRGTSRHPPAQLLLRRRLWARWRLC